MHEQNEIVKRKHKHIVKIGLIIIVQLKTPPKYQGFAFERTSYLIKTTTSCVLQNKYPYELLFNHKSNYRF